MTIDPMTSPLRQSTQRDDARKSPRDGGLDGERAAVAVHDASDTKGAGAASSGKGRELTAAQQEQALMSRDIPQEGAVREGYGVPVIFPTSVRQILLDGAPVRCVQAFSAPDGWVCALECDHNGLVIGPDRKPVEQRHCGRVEAI